MNCTTFRSLFQLMLVLLGSILYTCVHGQTHAPPCGLTAFEPEDWGAQSLSDDTYNFTFDIYTRDDDVCYRLTPRATTYYLFMLKSQNDDDTWTVRGGNDISTYPGSAQANGIRRYAGYFSIGDADIRESIRESVRGGTIVVSAFLEVYDHDTYLYPDIYRGDLAPVDLRDRRGDLLALLRRNPATSTLPEFAEFLFSGSDILIESEGRTRKVIQSPPNWSDIDHDAPYCNLAGSIYSSCIANNNVLSVTNGDGTITSYTLSVFKDRTNDTAIRLFSRTFDIDGAESGEYGDEQTITTDISCDATLIALTDETHRHRHIPTQGLKQACRWVADNVDRNVHNTFLAW